MAFPHTAVTDATIPAVAWNDMQQRIYAVAINTQTGTTYTLVLSDGQATVVRTTSASGVTVTVPPNSSVAYPVGTVIEVSQEGAGQVTISPGAGVTINSETSMRKIAAQYTAVSLLKTATDTWRLTGALTA